MMPSLITGFAPLDAKLATYADSLQAMMGPILEAEARRVQADTVAAVPVHSGVVREVLASGDAVKIMRDGRGNVVGFVFGFLTPEAKKRAYYYIWIETGREGGKAGGQRRSGRYKSGQIKYRRLGRNVGRILPRRIFAMRFEELRQRLVIERGVAKAIARFKTVQV